MMRLHANFGKLDFLSLLQKFMFHLYKNGCSGVALTLSHKYEISEAYAFPRLKMFVLDLQCRVFFVRISGNNFA